MKILVTGGCGFIGSHLVNKLIEKGHSVRVLDNLSSGKKDNLNKDAELVVGDVRDASDVRKAMKECEAVFHLAALSDVRSDGDITYLVNFLGTKNVVEVARPNDIKLIFASSAAVYGNAQIPNRENTDCNPISQYGKSKLRAERYIMNYYPEKSFMLRMFNVYGPGSHSAVNKFCNRIINYQDVVVFGNGLQTRDYIRVNDIIGALLLGLDHIGFYNAGTGNDVSVLRLIEIIQEISGCKANVKFTVPNKDDIARSRADITKISALDWTPKINLEDGIKSLLEYMGFKKEI